MALSLAGFLTAGFAVGFARAEEAAAPEVEASPSPPSAENEFLSLPSHDIEPVNATLKAMTVGDRVEFRVPGVASEAHTVDIPPGSDGENWALIAPLSEPSPVASELSFSITPLKPGKVMLPSLLIKRGEDKVGRTNPTSFDVASAISPQDQKPQEPEDIVPPLALPFPKWILALGAVLFLLGVGVGVFALKRWSKRRKKPEAAAPEAPRVKPDELALRKITELESQNLCVQRKFKPHYFGVSDVLKEYLGARYGFDALESTSRELVSALRDHGAGDDIVARVKTLYDRLDLVKFTDHLPPVSEGGELTTEARALVQETRRIAAATEGAKPGAV